MKLPPHYIVVLFTFLGSRPIPVFSQGAANTTGGGNTTRVNQDLTLIYEKSFISDLFNDMAARVMPSFNDILQDVLQRRYDPHNLEISGRKTLADLAGWVCKPHVRLDYNFGFLSGLGHLAVEEVTMDSGTEYLTGDPLGDARFGANFDMVGYIDAEYDVRADLGGDLKVSICGRGPRIAVNGTVGLKGTRIRIRSLLGGMVNMLQLRGSLGNFAIERFGVTYDEVEVEFSEEFMFENESQDTLQRTAETDIQDHLQQPLQDVVTEVAGRVVPFNFDF